MKDDVKKWLKKDGYNFLKDIGIKRKQIVLDFGCGEGHYTIPAARLVGNKGRVYVVDDDEDTLKKLSHILVKEGLKNIFILKKISNIKDSSVDIVLAYDIIHLLSSRQRLYKEIHRVLKTEGIFSAYPKHNKFDAPGWGLKDMSLKDIINEIEREGFYFKRRFFKKILHDDYINDGYILNFRKRKLNRYFS